MHMAPHEYRGSLKLTSVNETCCICGKVLRIIVFEVRWFSCHNERKFVSALNSQTATSGGEADGLQGKT
jgi:hypothetical protein